MGWRCSRTRHGRWCDGMLQRTVMPLIFSELASVYPPAKVNDPGSPLAAANGQFLLVEREAYFNAGGHRATGMNVVEDVALARAGEAIREGDPTAGGAGGANRRGCIGPPAR